MHLVGFIIRLLKAESFLSSFQPLRCVLRNLRFHYLVQRSLLLISVMSQLNYFHICMSCPLIAHLNIVAHQRTGFVTGPFTSVADFEFFNFELCHPLCVYIN